MIETILEFLCVLGTGVVAGGMIYCSHVELGARKKMSSAEKLANWHYAFPVAAGLFKPLGMVIGILLILCAVLTNNWIWYGAAAFTIALQPITIILIAGTNAKLLAMDENSDMAEAGELVDTWGQRHNIRTFCAVFSFLIAIFAVIF